jgi:hypothetical protein
MAGGPAPKWPVHGSTVDFHRGRRQGSPELGLAAAPLLTRARTTARRRRASDGGSAEKRARRGSGGEQEKAREREEKVWEWPGVLGGFYRGRGSYRGGVMAGNRRCKWR